MVLFALLVAACSIPMLHPAQRPTVHLAIVNITPEEYQAYPLPNGNCDLRITLKTDTELPRITIVHPKRAENQQLHVYHTPYQVLSPMSKQMFAHVVSDIKAWWGVTTESEIDSIHGEMYAVIRLPSKVDQLNHLHNQLPRMISYYYQHFGIISMTYACYDLPTWIVNAYPLPFSVIIP